MTKWKPPKMNYRTKYGNNNKKQLQNMMMITILQLLPYFFCCGGINGNYKHNITFSLIISPLLTAYLIITNDRLINIDWIDSIVRQIQGNWNKKHTTNPTVRNQNAKLILKIYQQE